MTLVTADELIEKAAAAKTASLTLAQASTESKNRALRAIADAIRAHEERILAANAKDTANASPRIELDRLRLTSERIAAMARDVEAVAGLADPIGEVFDRDHAPERSSNLETARTPWCCGRGLRVETQRDE